jgi:TIR domain
VAKRVFISYRREDTAPAAGRVYDRLCRLLPKSDVFFDVSTIGGGEIFDRRLLSEIERSDAVLVFIGRKWLEPAPGGEGGGTRLFAAEDYVRAELRAALARPILVLPVLVDGARMPRAEELPEDVRAITTRNALPLRHESFDDDTENIVATVLGGAGAARPWDDKGHLGARIAYTAAGLILASALLMIAALVHFMVMGRPLSASIGDAETTVLLIAGAILGACLGFGFEVRRRKRRVQARA